MSSGVRGEPRFEVSVNETPISALGYGEHLKSVTVELEEGRIPYAKISLASPNSRLLGDRNFAEDFVIGVRAGWGGAMLPLGNFALTMPGDDIGEGPQQLVLECFGEAVFATRVRRRRQFTNARASQIAGLIAEEEGWAADLVRTSTVYERRTQMNETNLSFLNRLARPIGYVVEVVNGTLYFGPRRSLEAEDMVAASGAAGDELALQAFRPRRKAIVGAQAAVAASLDRRAGAVVKHVASAVSQEGPMRAVAGSYGTGEERAERIVWGAEDPRQVPFRYVEPGWAVQGSQSEAQEVGEGVWRDMRWPIAGEARFSGHPMIVPGLVLRLADVGVYSGKWFVRRAVHSYFVRAAGYVVDAELISVARGALIERSPFGKRTSDSDAVDTVDMRPAAEGGQLAGTAVRG